MAELREVAASLDSGRVDAEQLQSASAGTAVPSVPLGRLAARRSVSADRPAFGAYGKVMLE